MRRRRPGEGGPPPLAHVPEQGELADHQRLATDVADGQVHLPGLVGEHPETGELVGERRRLRRAIAGSDADEHEETAADGAHDLIVDSNRSRADPLDDGSHRGLTSGCLEVGHLVVDVAVLHTQ
jgi:hypothetical protein